MTVAFALALAALSAGLAFGGAALQALEARQVPRDRALRASLLAALLRRPLWLLGTALNIVAFGLQVVALSLSSLAIVQPAFAVGLVVLAVIGVVKLGESLGVVEYAGGVAIIAGLVLLAFVAPRHDRIPLSGWVIAASLLALGLMALVLAGMRLTGRVDGLTASVSAGLLYAWLGVGGTLLDESFSHERWGLTGVWVACVVASAVLAVLAEMTALQSWPVTRSKPVVFVLQTILPALIAPFFSSSGFGPFHGVPFSVALAVVGSGSVAVARSGAVAEATAE